MAIYRITEEKDKFVPFNETSFEHEGIAEADLQRLQNQPEILEEGPL